MTWVCVWELRTRKEGVCACAVINAGGGRKRLLQQVFPEAVQLIGYKT